MSRPRRQSVITIAKQPSSRKAPQPPVSFEQRIQELKEYQKAYGHLRVPQTYLENKSLGWWVARMRKFRRMENQSYLTKSRIAILNKLGFVWDVASSNQSEAWKSRVRELKQFQSVHGHCRVPYLYQTNRALASFVHRMRLEYKKLKVHGRSALSPERRKDLDNLGFDWEVKLPPEEVWVARTKDLKEFKEQHGHCRVPHNYKKNKTLLNWVKSRRREYRKYQRGEESALTEEQIQELDGIGFDWNPGPCGGAIEVLGPRVSTRLRNKPKTSYSGVDIDNDDSDDNDDGESEIENDDNGSSPSRQSGRVRSERKAGSKSTSKSKRRRLNNNMALDSDETDDVQSDQSGRGKLSTGRKVKAPKTTTTMAKSKTKSSLDMIEWLPDDSDDNEAFAADNNSADGHNNNSSSSDEEESKDEELSATLPTRTTDDLKRLNRKQLISYFNNQLDQERQTSSAAHALLQESKDEITFLLDQLDQAREQTSAADALLQQSKDEIKLLCDVNKDLTKCNLNLRKSHQTAMEEERGNLELERKRRMAAEDRFEKVKQLIDFEVDESWF